MQGVILQQHVSMNVPEGKRSSLRKYFLEPSEKPLLLFCSRDWDKISWWFLVHLKVRLGVPEFYADNRTWFALCFTIARYLPNNHRQLLF